MTTADRTLAQLRAHGLKLACAESLTGGALSARIVGVAGASTVLQGAIVAYTPAMKTALLGVDAELLRQRGTVNHEVAKAMALGVREKLDADVSVSTTGVAGPGPSEGHPAGTVFIGISHNETVISEEFLFGGGRQEVREQTVAAALHLLDKTLAETLPRPANLDSPEQQVGFAPGQH